MDSEAREAGPDDPHRESVAEGGVQPATVVEIVTGEIADLSVAAVIAGGFPPLLPGVAGELGEVPEELQNPAAL
ncbi:hypothetical protein AB0C84_44410 [Actinomadura sp. NPDC048955]|uniref:hypothetical protein n=1 Tax=Actinomadura sp. NPDC048955 TaxID=3158228 RepID=UPI003401013B